LFILDQAIALKEEGKIQVGILFQDTHAPTQETLTLLKAHEISHIIEKTPYIPKASQLLIRLWCMQYFRAYRTYCQHFGTPDLIHAHSYIAGFAGAYISDQSGIPFVLTEHSTNFLNHQIRGVHRAPVKQVLEKATRLIVVGAALSAAISEWTDRPIVQLSNPIDPDRVINSTKTH
jgi:Glycosyltransferase Family 4